MQVFIFLVGFLLAFSGARVGFAEAAMPFSKAINIGNALEAPKGTPWDVTLENEYFTVVKKAGFDCVRLPVRLSDYAKDQPGYVLDEAFMKKLDGHIRYALKENLYVILDFHHFDEIMKDPVRYHDVYLAVWRQVAERYKNYSDRLVFEVLNEPHDQLGGELWNEYLAEAVTIIRKKNPRRYIIVGGDSYNSIDSLSRLRLPDSEKLILTVHYYEPPEFTFQNHQYLGYENYKDVAWTGSEEERRYLARRFDVIKQWAQEQQISVFLGEFGVNENVPEDMRAAWTTAVRQEAEVNGFSWGYWEFGSFFGAYDIKKRQWKPFLLDALLK